MDAILNNVLSLISENINYIVIAWYVGVFLCILFIYFKYDMEHANSFSDKIYKNIPIKYNPAVLSYFLTKKIGANSYVAAILDLIRNDLLVVVEENKIFYLMVGQGAELTKQEQMLRDFLLNKVGDGSKVAISQLREVINGSKTGPYFKNVYDSWIESSLFQTKMYKFYHKYNRNMFVFTYALIGMFLWLIYILKFNINYNNMNIIEVAMLFTIFVSIMLIVYLFAAKRRTEETNDAYYKWIAFSNYLKRFSIKNKDVDVNLIDTYFVYSLILGSYLKLRDDVLYNKKMYDALGQELKIRADVFLRMKPLEREIRRSVIRNKGRSSVDSTIRKKNNPSAMNTTSDIGDRGIGF